MIHRYCLLATLLAFFTLTISTYLNATGLSYELKPQKIADDTYVFLGKKEDFTFENGGNIVNTGFIVTQKGIVVIDTGPSRLYGEQMRTAIKTVSSKPIVRVYNTHHHPDHFLGNQAFDDVAIYALPDTIKAMRSDSDAFADNAYRMIGDWAQGTTPRLADKEVSDSVAIGGHSLEIIALQGHTGGDLAIFDTTTGVLFTGDLVFNDRTATTPHANVDNWLEALDKIQGLAFKTMVPGHGDIVKNASAVAQTRQYLLWLEKTLRQSADNGLDMIETIQQPIPQQFSAIPLVKSEYTRSVSHLFPAMEANVLTPAMQTR